MSEFVHLHLHTQYSLLDGANKIKEVVKLARGLGQQAMAITDHGNMHGVVEFYQAAKAEGVKPIIGCELYVTPNSRFERKTRAQGGAGTFHLTVLAQNLEGYRNLCRLVSLAYKEGFYFKPRVDHELLERYNSGLIALSGCLNGELSGSAALEDLQSGRKLIEFYSKIFKDRYYLELQPHNVPEQQRLNSFCIDLGKDLGIPLVATNDCHYPKSDDHHAQEVLMCISTGKQLTDPSRIRHDGVHLHLKTKKEVLAGFGGESYGVEAVDNAIAIAESCNVEFDFSKHYMPHFETDSDESLISIMGRNARDGLKRRLSVMRESSTEWSDSLTDKYKSRLEEEIRLIDRMGFAGYFLVVSDFIVWAKEQGIPVGPGRGSVAGSLVAYALRITEVDPIQHKLLFERFLNPDRVSLPDIDVDFCIYGRDRVIRYVSEKYGKDRVAQIATFGTMKAKAAIKDVGRALGLSFAETDRIAKLVPAPRQGFDFSLEESLKMEPRLAEYAAGEGKELISLALKLEGLTRHSSTHAAGVVIGDRPLMEFLPMMVDKDGNDVTQYSMSYVEKIGLVKFDFLGLKTLTVLATALKIIKQSKGLDIDLNLIPIDDQKTFRLLCAGNTTGVFQLESGGITDMTVRLKPSSFDDLVAILALYRPGPLDAGMVDHYIERKHGREPIAYLHPLMKNTLSDTYGIILYQEQIMQLARELAGYSLAEADILRKAMGKKNPEEMAKQKDRFLSGATQRGIDKKLAIEIFNQMETFARYGFNRSHSAAYALISYQTAYLKAHFNVEFMAALMSHETNDSDKTLKNLTECRKSQVNVLPPDVNLSFQEFSVEDNQIRFGLAALKGIGDKAISTIVEEREKHGHFQSFHDFVTRIDLKVINKRVIDSLVKSGAFDGFGCSRRDMYESAEQLICLGQSIQKEKESNQISLFGSVSSGVTAVPVRRHAILPEWPVNLKLAYEKEALGFYISGHPLEKFRTEIKRLGLSTTEDAKSRTKSQAIRIGGVVTALKLKNTKKGDRYASFVLEDWLGTIECLVWPDVYKASSSLIVSEEPLVVSGDLDVAEERRTLIVKKLESLIDLRNKKATLGVLYLRENDNLDVVMPKITSIFAKYQGNCPIKVVLEVDKAEVSMMLRSSGGPVCVSPSENVCNEIEQEFGRPVLSFM